MGPDLPLRVLFVVPYAPTRIRTRPFHFIRSLGSDGHRVTLATVWTNEEEREGINMLSAHLAGVVAERMATGRSLWNSAWALAGPQPLQASYSWCPGLASRIAAFLGQGDVDVVHVEHLRGARYGLAAREALVRSGAKGPPIVWDSVDCITELFQRAARESQAFVMRLITRLELTRTAAYEGQLLDRFDRVIVTSAADREGLLRLSGTPRDGGRAAQGARQERRVVVVPNGVDLDYFTPADEPREALTLVITGKMSYHANVTAVVRFIEDVLPLIWEHLPGVRLWVVGKDPAREILRLGVRWHGGLETGAGPSGNEARVLVTGGVSDIRPYLRRASLAVAPIRYGVGIQNKVLEAMACATPLVATPEAVAALPVQSGRELVVASGPRSLADAIVALLNDPEGAATLGWRGRAFVERQHGWRPIVKRLVEVYRDAGA